ncbi:unnamed protein product [Periconia digitata]|uniref:Uncharacterized protein n=1 Tax=Periconia digitata TaxID=1303443 RepID=A0A9W4URB5_9PLEO|nr:unnamed protein product [Periconia digitata]
MIITRIMWYKILDNFLLVLGSRTFSIAAYSKYAANSIPINTTAQCLFVVAFRPKSVLKY